MKQVIVKLRDNTEIEMHKEYEYTSSIRDKLNDSRDNFIEIGDYVFAKDTIASVFVKEVEETEE